MANELSTHFPYGMVIGFEPYPSQFNIYKNLLQLKPMVSEHLHAKINVIFSLQINLLNETISNLILCAMAGLFLDLKSHGVL